MSNTHDTIASIIERLGLQPHPEGGYYRETWRSTQTIPRDALPHTYSGDRAAGTGIYYLLPTGERSAPHKVLSDELWLWHAGDPMQLTLQDNLDAPGTEITLGQELCYQALVPGGVWQGATPAPGPHGYALVSCVVVPGFDFADFEMEPSS